RRANRALRSIWVLFPRAGVQPDQGRTGDASLAKHFGHPGIADRAPREQRSCHEIPKLQPPEHVPAPISVPTGSNIGTKQEAPPSRTLRPASRRGGDWPSCVSRRGSYRSDHRARIIVGSDTSKRGGSYVSLQR